MAIASALHRVTMMMMGSKKGDVFIVLSLQLVLLVLYGIFVRYDGDYKATIYPMFQDVHVMIFIGFGFLMTFLKRYGFSAVGFNFLLASLVIQWAILCEGFYDMTDDHKIKVSIVSLLRADVAAATVLISMGAVLGKTSYVQLLIMGVIEIAIFTANACLGSKVFKVVDAGDSIFVHAFGAYFGLAVSYVLEKKKTGSEPENSLEGSSYTSDLFSMIGTVFLWMFWPSFNSAELEGDQQLRAVINTYLSLTSCCVTAFAASAAFTSNNKFDMVHIQNATLAGGVAVGTSAGLQLQPYGALIIGILAGALSVFGFSVLTPFLNKRMNVHDTCGVHNLHGMPGVLAGIIGALMAGIATEDVYGKELYDIYGARAAGTDGFDATDHSLLSGARTAWQQAGYQLLAVVVTICISIVSGLVTGSVLCWNIFNLLEEQNFDDEASWKIPDNDQPDDITNGIILAANTFPPQHRFKDDVFWSIHESEHTDDNTSLKVTVAISPEQNTEGQHEIQTSNDFARQK